LPWVLGPAAIGAIAIGTTAAISTSITRTTSTKTRSIGGAIELTLIGPASSPVAVRQGRAIAGSTDPNIVGTRLMVIETQPTDSAATIGRARAIVRVKVPEIVLVAGRG
jgi:hypothetical protein